MSEFWFYVIGFGIVIGGIFSIVFTYKCKKWYTKLIGIITTMIVAGFLIGGSFYSVETKEDKIWNNGYCQCGGQWKLISVWRNDYTYECPDCLKVIETYGSKR